jgi:hypothetical protein
MNVEKIMTLNPQLTNNRYFSKKMDTRNELPVG